VGGAETFPVAMLPILSPSGIIFELLRYGANWVSFFSPALRDMIRKADAVVPSHPDVTRLLVRMRGSEAGIHPLLVTAFTAGERQRIEELSPTPKLPGAPLEAFCGGLLEGRKGVSLAIRAIALAKPRGLRIHYRICAHGPELEHLKKLTRQLGLENEVTFQAPLRGSAYHQALNDADIYLLPSLRDNAPLTLMEAMLAGCVPVVADCGGPAFIVTRECGIKVTVRTASKAIKQIAEALLELQAAPDLRATLGQRAKQRIRENFTMERYLEETHRIYRAAGYTGSFDSSAHD
jgi:glycosyltransferase involved in cell wall biosynthesis